MISGNFFKNNKTKGFTLVEMIIYLAIMTVLTLVITQSLVVVLKSNRDSFAEISLRNAGYSAMEEMLREIHLSESIDQASGGILQMEQNAGANIVKFSTSSNSVLNLYEGQGTTVLVGPLISKDVLVKNLIFTPINTGKSLAVRIQIQLETAVEGKARDEWFYSTGILRGSY
jgi:prepilin-type N-terminal cleavage/methylation domain-containing protein